MDESKRWVYLICLTASCSLFLSFLLEAAVVGIFFVLPYFSDCGTGVFSPLESSTCLTSSARSSNFTLPPSCRGNSSFSISYCSQTGCELNVKSRSCSAPRCCCRSIPQTLSLVCMDKRFDVSINTSCVYTTCERSLHSVLVQLYPASNTIMPLPPLHVRIGRNTLRTNGSMVLFTNLAEGEYAVSIGDGGPINLSTEYFHASRLIVDFNSPPELVYVVYVKQLMSSPMVGTCMVSQNTTVFSNPIELLDRLTLPNNFLYNDTLFIPEFLAFTSSIQTPINFSITCGTQYHMFQYSNTTWIDHGVMTSFNIASQENGALWALSSDEDGTNLTSLTFCIDSVGSALSVDRGAVALVCEAGSLFASRVTLSNNVVSSIPLLNRTNLEIRYVTSPFSQVSSARSPPAIIIDGSLGMPLNNCESPYIPVNSSILTAVLSETNLLDSAQSCYYLINTTQITSMTTLIFSILVMNPTDNSTVSFSTLETNAARACVRYPCTSQDACLVSVDVKGGMNLRNSTHTCSSLGRTSLSECNLQLKK